MDNEITQLKLVAPPKPITLGVMESIYATSNGRLPLRRRSQMLWLLVDCAAIGAFSGFVAMVVKVIG